MRLRSGVNIAVNSRQGANKHTPFFLTPVFFKRSASFSLISLSDGIDCSSTSSMPNVVPSISFASGSTLLNVRELDPRTAEAHSILEERRRLHLYPVLTFLCDLIPPQRRPSLLVKHSQSHEFASLSIELLHRATTWLEDGQTRVRHGTRDSPRMPYHRLHSHHQTRQSGCAPPPHRRRRRLERVGVVSYRLEWLARPGKLEGPVGTLFVQP